jgi:hypothetical protein
MIFGLGLGCVECDDFWVAFLSRRLGTRILAALLGHFGGQHLDSFLGIGSGTGMGIWVRCF